MSENKTSDKEQKPPLPIEVILGAFAVDALQENFDYLKRWAGDVKIETYNGVPVVRLGFALSARTPIADLSAFMVTHDVDVDFCYPGNHKLFTAEMTERWQTPPEIFEPLMREFSFDLDAAADYATTRAPRFLDDALPLEEWPGERIWLNPPYGRKLAPFVRRAAQEAAKGKLVVALIPFRCRASWWHEAVVGRAAEVRCIRKRPKFMRADGTRPKLTGTCDSCIVIWHGKPAYTRLTSFFQTELGHSV